MNALKFKFSKIGIFSAVFFTVSAAWAGDLTVGEVDICDCAQESINDQRIKKLENATTPTEDGGKAEQGK